MNLILYFVLRIMYKCKIGSLMYPILHLFGYLFNITNLPTLNKSYRIIKKYTNKNHLYVNNCNVLTQYGNKRFDLQIIIPTYNSDKYINACLNSILDQQTKYTYRIIIINDGSTDKTLDILNNYKSNPLIKIISQKNRGRASARNVGLRYAYNSKYIMFVDSDDKLVKGAIQHLLNNAFRFHSDITFGSYIRFNDKNKFYDKTKYNNNNNIALKNPNNINGYLWGKVFKSSLFKHVSFPDGYEFEDTILMFWIYPRCKIINSIGFTVYMYRNNPKSISNTFSCNNTSIDSFLITLIIIKKLSEYHIYVTQYIYECFLMQVKMNCLRNIHIESSIQKSIFVLTSNMLFKYFNKMSTNMNSYKSLEKSLKNKDYCGYMLSCILK